MSLADDIRNSRNFIQARGDEVYRGQVQRGEIDRGEMDRYRRIGEEYYTPMLEGLGGYTDEEARNIVGDDRLRGLQSADNYDDWYYNDAEQAQMHGDPNSRYRYMDWDGAIGRQNESTGRQRDALSGMRYDLGAAVGDDLKLDGNYYRDTDAAVSGSDAAANAALNKDDMTMSQDFVNRYRMSPEQRRRIETAGALRTRAAASAGVASAEAAARASGVGALGMAALKSRARRNADVDAADNMVGGRLAADEASANREKTIEGMRLDSGTRYGLAKSDLSMRQGDRRLGMMSDRERMRLGSAQDISNRRMSNAREVGNQEIGIERDAGNRAMDLDRYYTSLGTDIATGIDRDYRQTAQQIANTRVGAARARAEDQFNRGRYVDSQYTARYGGVADARRDDQREARGWFTGQQQMSNQNSQNEYGRQVQTYGAQSGAMNQADLNRIQQDRAPRLWERIAQVGIGAVGAASGAKKAWG